MSERFAVRNIRLCTKDCLCLYVCPTGATDTENSVIDIGRCIGCGACADACPSAAISMVPKTYPVPQPKDAAVAEALRTLARSKAQAEHIATALPGKLAAALAMSNRLMLEDLLREAGYMLPQGESARAFLETAIQREPEGAFPKAAAQGLLDTLHWAAPTPATANEKWQCGVCGYIHEGPLPDGFTCPRCKKPASVFVRLEV